MSSVFSFLRLPSIDLIKANWRSGLTVAFISVPLSVAISIASGAGPLPGIITGIVATAVASIFGSNNYNVVGAAGALSTVLFAATIAAPFGLGPSVLPILAIVSGLILLATWAIGADTFLYYIPSSVMYGFSAGVAFLIAASQLFDATGLSKIKRTGTFLGDITLYLSHMSETHATALVVFALFLAFILIWKRFITFLPAIIPASVLGVLFGWAQATFMHMDLISLGDKFGTFSGALALPVAWQSIPALLSNPSALTWTLQAGVVIALISILETLITAKIADNITKTQSSAKRELFGLGLANIASGVMGGLPATGVFIRTGANIKAGATHRTSAFVAAACTTIIALIVLPLFTYIPMAVIAAMLVNTAIGLIELEKFREFWARERSSFSIALLVIIITVLHDAGTGVAVGALLALLFFAHSLSRGRFDVIFNFKDGTTHTERGSKILHIPHDKDISVVTYSIAGFLGYIDSERHAANFRHLAHTPHIDAVIIRLRDLFAIDYEGTEMLAEAILEIEQYGKKICISSANPIMAAHLKKFVKHDVFCSKTKDALHMLGVTPVIA